jgi:hypothetical protein
MLTRLITTIATTKMIVAVANFRGVDVIECPAGGVILRTASGTLNRQPGALRA